MKLKMNTKRIFLIVLFASAFLCLLYYTRERRFVVDDQTEILIEFNGINIVLSPKTEAEFKKLLNTIRIRRPINSIDERYHTESTIFIRIHDKTLYGNTRGVLTVCLDDISKGNFLGFKPEGRYKVNKDDMQSIADFLSSLIASTTAQSF